MVWEIIMNKQIHPTPTQTAPGTHDIYANSSDDNTEDQSETAAYTWGLA